MLPIEEINTDDGLYIKLSDGSVFSQTAAEIQARLASTPGNLAKKETVFNTWLQSQEPFIKIFPIGEYPEDHQVNVDPDNLPPWRIMLGAFVDEVIVWVAVHFYNDDPLVLIPKCSDRNFPIEGDWWL